MALKKATRPLKFKALDQAAPWKGFSMLVYGDPGCGKTYLAGTAVNVPEMQRVMLFDNDGGSRTLRGKPEFAGISLVLAIGADHSDYIEILKWFSGVKVDASIKALLDPYGSPKEFKTVIIDNIGALQWEMMRNILSTIDHNRPHSEATSQQDYGILRSRMKNLFRIFAEVAEATGITFIFTAHGSYNPELRKIYPALDGRAKTEVAGDLPIVTYMEVSKPKRKIGQSTPSDGFRRVLHFDPTENSRLTVKDQSEKLGSMIINPTMAKIYKAIYGQK